MKQYSIENKLSFKWVELYGTHTCEVECSDETLKDSQISRKSLWTYIALDSETLGFSHEAIRFVNRRKSLMSNSDKYIVSKLEKLDHLTVEHELIVYIDFHNIENYYSQLLKLETLKN